MERKRASNTFVGGLITDRHPITAQNTELVEAQNIDLLAVGEGYQLVLQKREGNTELLVTPEQWSDTKVYVPGDYVSYSGGNYVAIVENTNDTPSNLTNWIVYEGTLVPAGLREGLIPLAVEEFNNIAYIVSVHPGDNTVELGTFPSPNYDLFKYVTGSAIPGGATVETHVWDPTADSYDYAFTVSGITPATDTVSGNIGWPADIAALVNVTPPEILPNAQMTITNTGALSDTFTITTDKSSGLVIKHGVDVVSSISLAFEEAAAIDFYLENPYQETLGAHTVNVTITPLNGSLSSTKYHTFDYETTEAFWAKRNNDTVQWWTPSGSPDELAKWVPGTLGLDDTVSAASLTARYDWQSNNPTITELNVSFTNLGYTPPNPDPIWTTESMHTGQILQIVVEPNIGVDSRTAHDQLSYNTLTMEFSITQSAP